MRRPRPHVVRLIAASAALVAVPFALGACDQLAEEATEKAIENAAEEDGRTVDVEFDDDGIQIEGSDGTVDIGVDSELPEDFPDEVPLLDGTIVSAVSSHEPEGGEGWIVLMQVDGAAEEVFDVAGASLEQAGFAQDGEPFGTAGAWKSATWQVALTVSGDGTTTSVQYYVGPADG